MFERQLPHENLNRAIADAMRAANMTPGGPAAPVFATAATAAPSVSTLTDAPLTATTARD